MATGEKLMAQHDYEVLNASGAQVRADINSALQAVVSNNSGLTEPNEKKAHMWWVGVDQNNAGIVSDELKIRNKANNGWVLVGNAAQTNLGLATLASPSFTGRPTITMAEKATGETDSYFGTVITNVSYVHEKFGEAPTVLFDDVVQESAKIHIEGYAPTLDADTLGLSLPVGSIWFEY